MKDFILLGIQGSGKGTQARLLVEKYGFKLMEMGKELRTVISSGSDLGNKIKGIMDSGNLVSDEVVMEIVDEYLKNISSEEAVLFDGVPRRVTQKDLFEKVMKKYQRSPEVIHINITDEEALKRLSNRWMSRSTGKIFPSKKLGLQSCSEDDLYQRDDDKPEAILQRINVFHENTQPVVDWYKKEDRYLAINGMQNIDGVTAEIAACINVG